MLAGRGIEADFFDEPANVAGSEQALPGQPLGRSVWPI
jgi:hypothetical protein